jgi:hypothetical protein
MVSSYHDAQLKSTLQFYEKMIRKKMAVETLGAFGLAECQVSKCFCTLHRGRFDFRHLSPCHGARDESLHQSSKKATTNRGSLEDSPKASSKNKEGEKVVGDEDKQDNALRGSKSLFSPPYNT